jgi:hypothetical protein
MRAGKPVLNAAFAVLVIVGAAIVLTGGPALAGLALIIGGVAGALAIAERRGDAAEGGGADPTDGDGDGGGE